MSGPAGNWHYPERRHLRICAEGEWGACPAEPSWHAVPVRPDGFGVRAERPYFRPEGLFTGFRPSIQLPLAPEVTGTFGAPLYPEAAELLLGMGLDRQDGEPGSYCLDLYTPADPRRILGAVADRLVLGATGEGLTLELGLIAAEEIPNDSLVEGEFDYSYLSPMPFALRRARVTVDGDALSSVERFSLTVENNVAAGPKGPDRICFLAGGRREVTVVLEKLDNTDRFSSAVRSGEGFSLEAEFSHPLGHALTVSLPALRAESNQESAAADRLARAATRARATTDGSGVDVACQVILSA